MKKTASCLLAIIITWSLVIGCAFAEEHGHHERREHYNAKLYGVIETMPKGGHEGIWSIGGNDVVVTKQTKIKEKEGPVAIGQYVKIKAQQTGEKFIAYRIEVEDQDESEPGVTRAKIYGTVEKMPENGVEGTWQINGRKLLVTRNTKIEEKHDKLSVGVYVELEGNFIGKTFTVTEIEVKGRRHHKSHRGYNSQFVGKIESLPQKGFEGRWVVDSHQIEVTDKTLVDETIGKASIGCEVIVKGIRKEKLIKAFEIKITKIQQ